MTTRRGKAQCWNIPARGDLPALTVVQEDGTRPYVIGERGPRILTDEERLRWMEFKLDLLRGRAV